MIKFYCGECGHRLAVQKRQLKGLIVCPDCGGTTHPLAEQILRRRGAAIGQVRPRLRPMHICANCGGMIGRLQQLHLWENQVVCDACQRKLSGEAAPELQSQRSATVVRVSRRALPAPLGEAEASDSPLVQQLARSFRGGMFGALVGLTVAGAALYGALNLLKDAAGLITGLAFGALALLSIYAALRMTILARKGIPPSSVSRLSRRVTTSRVEL